MASKSSAVHVAQFFKPKVRAIHCMRLSSDDRLLAISRSDHVIEIWNVEYSPHLERTIVADRNSSIEGLEWCSMRLFSCGMQGTVLEYDLNDCCVKTSTSVTGGVAWCLAYSANNNLIAVGTEGGYLNIFTVVDWGLEYLKQLDKQQGRVLCMCWDNEGRYLITGSVDLVRVWDLASCHVVHKMSTGRIHTNKETVVWSVSVTKDFTIISGDSRGMLTFWDGKLGTQIESVRSHDADVLSVAVTSDEKNIVCAGVDPVVAIYGRVSVNVAGRKHKWAKGGLHRIEDHDIRAITVARDGRIFCGGVSGYLTVTGVANKQCIKCPPLPLGQCIRVLPKVRQVLVRYLDSIELWIGGKPSTATDEKSDLPLSAKPSCLLRLQALPGQTILCAAASLDGKYLAYSTQTSLRFFRFDLETKSVKKLVLSTDCEPCKLMSFYIWRKKNHCILVTKHNEVVSMEFDNDSVDASFRFRPIADLRGSITLLEVLKHGSVLAVADCNSHVSVWSLPSMSPIANIPTRNAIPTALSFASPGVLYVAYSDKTLISYDLDKQKYIWKKSLAQFATTIAGIVPDPLRHDYLLAYDDSVLSAIIKKKTGEFTLPSKKKKRQVDDSSDEALVKCNDVRLFKHIAGCGWLGKDELFIAEVTPLMLSESLPPALYKKKFGT